MGCDFAGQPAKKTLRCRGTLQILRQRRCGVQADPVAEQRDSSTDGFGRQAKIPLSLGGSQHFAAMGAERIVSVAEACQLMLLLSQGVL